MDAKPPAVLRQPPETRFAAELEALVRHDAATAKPSGWRLSPRAVRTFILGSEADKDLKKDTRSFPAISRKFLGDDALVDRAIITLMTNRGLLLIGEPGTAKSLLSELLSAAISGRSTLTVQGTAGTTEEQIKYAWNKALLQAEGPTPRALVPAPLHECLAQGHMMRFEEIARCPAHILDSLITVLSDKVLFIPELKGDEGILFARPGFNVIATANTRDKGIHEMSSALKRRFNFEIVAPLNNKKHEMQVVRNQAGELLATAGAACKFPDDVLEVLITAFRDLRRGLTDDGAAVERPEAVLSTAEAIAVSFACGLEAYHFGDGEVGGDVVAHHFIGTVLKDSAEDAKSLRNYFNAVIRHRAHDNPLWKAFYDAGRVLLG